MGIKEIRMRYRQKALPNRGEQFGLAVNRLANYLRDASFILSRAKDHLDHQQQLERYAQYVRSLSSGAIRGQSTYEHLQQAVQLSENALDIIRQIPDTDGFEDGLSRLIQEAQSFLQIQESQSWNDATPVRIAQNIIRTRDFESAPILADALEEAGCTDERLLRYLRNPAINSFVINAVHDVAGIQ